MDAAPALCKWLAKPAWALDFGLLVQIKCVKPKATPSGNLSKLTGLPNMLIFGQTPINLSSTDADTLTL